MAQADVGTVSGTVTDDTGGVIPGVEVTLNSVNTGSSVTAITSDEGFYVFNSVLIGEYSQTAVMSGFKSRTDSGIRVVSGETVTLAVELSIGEVSETVEVTAALPNIDKQTNKAGYARVNEEIARLPLSNSTNNRQALSFLRTMPGVSYNPNDSNENNAMSTAFVQGSPGSAPSYNIDGVRAGSSTHQNGRDDTGPIPELVQEFRLDTNTTAEQGWDTGVAVNLIFKSGTNDFHGDIFWYVQNDKFNARPWAAGKRSQLRHNEIGFVVGGPLWKNRSFFFGGVDIYKFRNAPTGTTITVPTAKMRSGDFSEILGGQIGTDLEGNPVHQGGIYDPLTTRDDGAGGFIRDMFPGNVIPADRFSSITQGLVGEIGMPNRPGVTNNWVGGNSLRPIDKESWYIKLDHQVDEAGKHKISFGTEQSWKMDMSTYPMAFTERISSLHNNEERQYRYRFSYYWTIRPNVLLNLRAGAQRTPRAIGTQGAANDTAGYELGIRQVPGPSAPFVGIEGMTGYGPIFQKLIDPSQTVPINLDVTWVKGSHNFKFGAQYLISVSRQILSIFDQGSFNFHHNQTALPDLNFKADTGFGFASQMLGEVDNAFVWAPRAFKHNGGAWAVYLQDSWRVNNKLTINYGLRNDIFVPTGEGYDRIGAFSQTVSNPSAGGLMGGLTFWGDGPGRNGFKRVAPTMWFNLGPRLGFAYSIDDKTVIRASGGFMYFPLFGAMTSGFNTPFLGWALDPSVNSLDAMTPAFNWEDGFGGPGWSMPELPDIRPDFANGQSVQEIPRTDMKPGTTMTVNVGLERELGWGVAVRANYHGKFSHSLPSNNALRLNQLHVDHLALGNLLNQPIDSQAAIDAGFSSPYDGFSGNVAQALRPFPHMLNIDSRGAPVNDLTYHALALSLQKRYGNGLTFMINHTISKAIGNAAFSQQGHGFGRAQHTSHRHMRFVYEQDRTHIFAASWMYQVPFGKGRFGGDLNSGYKAIVSGWTVGMTHNYFTGYPIRLGSTTSYPGGFGGIWPDKVPGIPVANAGNCGGYDPNNPDKAQFLNPLAYTNPEPFTLGDSRIISSTRPCSYYGENLTLQKDFAIGETWSLRIGFDAFNIFNRHIFESLNSNTNDTAGFGTYSGTSTFPRYGQFHISLHF